MSVSHRYRNFGGKPTSSASSTDGQAEAIEDQKLQAFEAGYQAGWDDALKAQTDEKNKLSAELSQNLLDMSFTYREALSKLTSSIEPIIGQIVEKLLPEMVSTALGAHIIEQVTALAHEQSNGAVEIVVAPQNTELVEKMIGDHLKEPFSVVAENDLGAGQAFVRIAQAERQVDLDSVIKDVAKAMAGFFEDATERGANGQL
ncbi:MAG: ABC transporter ATP-binding protein [Roseobacter sp.]|jgi:flagellar assembly protein FliH|nr:ABC transporter ATP-binding protein [Roseobacter sp.]